MSMISVIIPAFNEAENLENLMSELSKVLAKVNYSYEVIFINDGSDDETEPILKSICENYDSVYYINFSRNFGQQNALKAGYDKARGEAVISLDADLQNPPEILFQFIKKWEQGFDIVVCKRKGAKQNSGFVKGITSRLFYHLLSLISEIKIEKNCPDFRLLDRKVVDVLKEMPETDIFLRGIISWLGFKKTVVEYEHVSRAAGATHYTFSKMIRLAFTGLTSFSVKPLYISIYLGVVISALAVCYIPYVFYLYSTGETISGWASLMVTIAFFGGLQLFVLGIIGLYIGKSYMQGKKRPSYIIQETNIPKHDAIFESSLLTKIA